MNWRALAFFSCIPLSAVRNTFDSIISQPNPAAERGLREGRGIGLPVLHHPATDEVQTSIMECMECNDAPKPDFLGVDWLDLGHVSQLHSSLLPHHIADVETLLRNTLDEYSDCIGLMTSFIHGLEGMARPELSEEQGLMASNISNYGKACLQGVQPQIR